ncbi:hypothetical protein ACN38_g6616 [Penicillium nordicum]|uniref:Uncharacterized protein n=1 Tax=Penicillium nordicum TaxID=229535 RepID=A0A0N0RYP6_9EURO|nr:hypothetical protein ACN38_g6616 [Penicillium nordicum]
MRRLLIKLQAAIDRLVPVISKFQPIKGYEGTNVQSGIYPTLNVFPIVSWNWVLQMVFYFHDWYQQVARHRTIQN